TSPRRIGHHHDVRLSADQRHRREIGDRIVVERRIEKAIGRVGHRGDVERVAVGIGSGCDLSADIGAGAAAVLDDHLLTPGLGEPIARDGGDRVGGAAGHERNDEADVTRGPSLWGRSLWGRSLWGRSLWGRSLWGRSLWGRSLWGRSLWGRSLWGRSLWGRS